MKFNKISALSSEDRTKLKEYWSDLWGSEFATALTTDFKSDAKKVDVKANSNSTKKQSTVKKITL